MYDLNIDEETKEQIELTNQKKELRNQLRTDMHLAQKTLNKYSMTFSIHNRIPKYGEVHFNHPDVKQSPRLKRFVGKYGFVVPLYGTKDSKYLKGERRMKY